MAQFYIVYISEAHAADDRRPVGYAEQEGIVEPTSYGQRCEIADGLFEKKKLTVPCLVDGMDNKVAELYQAHPDRFYLVRQDGRLGIAGGRGPRGFKPALEAAEKWLAEYKKNGQDPDVEKYASVGAGSRDERGAAPRRAGRRLGVRLEGMRIISIADGSAAAKAGLRVGDVIVAVDGAPVKGLVDLAGKLRAGAANKTIVVRRGKHEKTVEAVWDEPRGPDR